MALYGMDVEQVRSLASLLTQKADSIEQVIQEITNRLAGTDWKGPDAEQFRNDWNSTLVPSLRRVKDTLTETSQRATRNAQDQEQASAH